MNQGEPSRTALAAAAHRAAHQMVDGASIFADPLASRILGPAAALSTEETPSRRRMRHFIAARSAIAREQLAEAVTRRAVRQAVILGAGLDTTGCRAEHGDMVKVYEVDHPATQAWKRQRLADAAIPVPASMEFVPVDFERDSLEEALGAAGLLANAPAVFIWLGVVPYLTRDAIMATLRMVGARAGGSEILFDYSDPVTGLDAEAREAHDQRAAAVARLGEPFLSRFEPADMQAMLQAAGFRDIEDLSPRAIARRFPAMTAPPEGAPDRGGHVVSARTIARGL